MEDIKKSFWNDAAMGGAMLGVAIFLFTLLCWAVKLDITAAWTKSLFIFISIGMTIWHCGKRRSLGYGAAGYGYSQAMGFTISIMLFAGVIVGFSEFLMQQYIAPDYYKELTDLAMARSGVDIDSAAMEQGMQLAQKLMKSPIFMILAGVLNMVIYGTFIGLLIAPFIKRNPDIFVDDNK